MGMKSVLLFFIGFSAPAAFAAKVDCTAAQNIENGFLKLDTNNHTPAYEANGSALFENKAWPLIAPFDQVSASATDRGSQFKCVVSLAAIAGGWDGEGASIGLIAKHLKDAKLKVPFEEALSQLPDLQRAEGFCHLIQIRMCHDKYGDHETDKQIDYCEKTYIKKDKYLNCAFGTTGSKEKKSPNKVAVVEPCKASPHQPPSNANSGFFAGAFLRALGEYFPAATNSDFSSVAARGGGGNAVPSVSASSQPQSSPPVPSRRPASLEDAIYANPSDSSGVSQ